MCDLSHDPPNQWVFPEINRPGRASADGSVQGRSSESEASCEGNQWNLPSGDFIVI